ncbi:MAG: cytochrome b/b6 domain-containing protein [Deltaproteobacteria bacterium]|nr:cytochrome b/b6 domain-containing protein [Deltaproteobacteria bacterium]
MNRLYLHPLPLRIWHWFNALVVAVLIGTGLYLRGEGVAALRPHDPALLAHKAAGLLLVVATCFWLVYALSNPQRRGQYRFQAADLRNGFFQAKYYLHGIFQGGENPFQPSAAAKYNPLQKLAYDTVMFLFLPWLSLTGLLFLDVPLWRPLVLAENWMGVLGFIHVALAYLLVLYLLVHLYMATLGKTVLSHTRAMLSGYEEQREPGPREAENQQEAKGNNA